MQGVESGGERPRIPEWHGGPQATIYRRLRRLRVEAMGREVRGVEEAPARYLLFCAAMIVTGVLTIIDARAGGRFVPLWGAVLVILPLLFQPSHRQLLVTLDTEDVRFRWLAFGFLPVYSRTFELRDRVLRLGSRTDSKEESGVTLGGCLSLALPFPLSLIYFLWPKDPKRVLSQEVRTLRLDGLEDGRELMCLQDVGVALEFLQAVAEMLPGAAEVSPEMVLGGRESGPFD